MKLTLILIFNILILNTTHATEIIDKCEDLLRKKQYAEAVLYANKKLSSQHNDSIHFFCRGQARFALSNLDEAESDFEIISRNKKTVESNRFLSFLYLAKIYALQNNFDKAINLLTTKLEILKDKPAIRRIYLNELADIHSKNQQLTQAINYMYDSLLLSANDNDRAFAYKKLAFFYEKSNILDKSIEFNLKASLAFERLDLLDDYLEVSLSLVRNHLAVNNLRKAEEMLQMLEILCVENGHSQGIVNVYFLQSIVLTKKGEPARSREKLMLANDTAIKFNIKVPTYE